MHPIIIIGTGLAGYQLARELRKINTEIPLILITADDGQFYPKPKLSTALTQKQTADTLATANANEMAAQLNATIYTQCHISTIDPKLKAVYVKDEVHLYSQLVLAMGADVIKPPLKGNAVAEVLSINHIYHYAAFADLIKNKKTIGILGTGLIGCEFANDLSNAHYRVHLIAPAKWPLDILIPEKIGRLLQNALEEQDVHFHFQSVVDRVDKTEQGYCLELSNGSELEVDFVLSAIGLQPHTMLAKSAGILVNRGIVVNRFLETSIPHIFALGDCAEVEGHVLPYITPILNCSKALAKTLNGEKTAVTYPAMPVMVKTPAHPIAVCPPPKDKVGQWDIQTDGHNSRALFYVENTLWGFVLTNEAVKERAALAQQIPALF